MGVNAAQNFVNQATFHSTFPISVNTKIFVNTDSWNVCLNLPFDISRPVALRFHGLYNFNAFLFSDTEY